MDKGSSTGVQSHYGHRYDGNSYGEDYTSTGNASLDSNNANYQYDYDGGYYDYNGYIHGEEYTYIGNGTLDSSNDTYSHELYNYYDGYYHFYGYDNSLYYYTGFEFERPVYLYIWAALIILTTLANILVVVVLKMKSMRNATNIILIAVAMSDSLTGLVTLPVIIHTYQLYVTVEGNLALTREWCQAFMIIRYFISRGFHTMSIWLTVVLGFQRLISVSFPFRAQSMFSIRNTVVIILIVAFLSPFLHIYHAFNSKVTEDLTGGGSCEWKVETPCKESCAYLWLVIVLMHFIPCLLLVIFTVLMVIMMHETTKKMEDSQMIANKANLHRRHVESKRISCIVIAVVVVFLIPEIPYGVFLLVQLSLKHSKKNLLELKTSRGIICAYEILLVLSFHANFWIYLIINRRFRRGLRLTFEPLELFFYAILGKSGIQTHRTRRRSDSTIGQTNSQTAHSRLSRSNCNSCAPLELRTYCSNEDPSDNGDLEGRGKKAVAPLTEETE